MDSWSSFVSSSLVGGSSFSAYLAFAVSLTLKIRQSFVDALPAATLLASSYAPFFCSHNLATEFGSGCRWCCSFSGTRLSFSSRVISSFCSLCWLLSLFTSPRKNLFLPAYFQENRTPLICYDYYFYCFCSY